MLPLPKTFLATIPYWRSCAADPMPRTGSMGARRFNRSTEAPLNLRVCGA